ncbi:steroid 17-alpha-hydroxylase/17,20 lyase [Lingula anatina]|uniref:Steroid 17-alpha-hydroxylase/17,20 lyase n=1 Tax=Lingula anatina TaxID=7574 RepID=A0A1S3J9B6_LINAN|nr:steroid 17-alpha-hydroxylase/17,20 lyase [Lingula anatina]XP_013406463.1 steroid 17-alpha-hydroxylase/17,20 lyase [Lingula anatina]XP_013406464.1 steroid 17-alpha-hydroxylase/17,20 lyase [Lingula anatina]|eukprot:XP_013406462.1 steroid 17-alpha-hydroxylase/17,20 lyase [Lingula anatina]
MYVLTLLSLLTVKTALVGIAVFLLVISYLQRKKYKLPPGPPQLPILGSYFEFRKDSRLYSVFTELGKSFSDLFTVDLGFWHNVVVLKSADIVHEAFVEKKEIFAGRETLTWKFKVFSGGNRDILFSDYGPVWRLQRQMVLKAFRAYVASDKLETFVRSSFDEVATLIEKETEPFDIDPHFHYKIDEPEFVLLKGTVDKTMATVFGSIIPSDVIPVLKHVPIPSSLSVKRLIKKLTDFQNVKLAEHKTTLNSGNLRDIMDQILILKEELGAESDDNAKESLTDTRIRHTLLDIFFGGTQTTVDTLKWMIMYVADNPEVQTKLHKELDALGDDISGLRHCRHKLPYSEAVQREVLRMRPVAPVGVGHQALSDTKLGAYDIPKGTVLYANIMAIHHDPKNWESPEIFKPERFINSDGSLKEVDNKIWIPFSSGKRKCVGESVARANLMMISALFFSRFEVSFPHGQKPDFEPAMSEFTCIPKPQKIIVKKRK